MKIYGSRKGRMAPDFMVKYYLNPAESRVVRADGEEALLMKVREILDLGAECIHITRMDFSKNYGVVSGDEIGAIFNTLHGDIMKQIIKGLVCERRTC